MVDPKILAELESILYDMNYLKNATDPRLAAYALHWARRLTVVIEQLRSEDR